MMRTKKRFWVITAGLVFFLTACAQVSTGQAPSGGSQPTARPQQSTSPQQPASGTKVDPQLVQRLQTVMVPLIQHMNHPIPLDQVKVGILNDPSINAANAGGGEFYVTMGLLQKANDEELRGVLAHEIAHADLGHVAKAKALGTGLNIGTIILGQLIPGAGVIAPAVADLGVMRPYSRKEEYQADAHGVEILKRTGYNGKQIMADTLTWLLKTSGPSGGFLSDHPGTADRIKRIESMPS